MGARAEAAEAVGHQILDAFIALVVERPLDGFSLEDVAGAAGVSTRTVIRRFGGKAGLLTAAVEYKVGAVAAERGRARVGDVPGAVRVLVAHYERLGAMVLRLLAEEGRRPELVAALEQGRMMHSEWCEHVFAPALVGLRGVEHRVRLAQLVAVCDVYTWKVLREDRGLSPAQTRRALVGLVDAICRER
jgi:AcrR family transcriptional regulator